MKFRHFENWGLEMLDREANDLIWKLDRTEYCYTGEYIDTDFSNLRLWYEDDGKDLAEFVHFLKHEHGAEIETWKKQK